MLYVGATKYEGGNGGKDGKRCLPHEGSENMEHIIDASARLEILILSPFSRSTIFFFLSSKPHIQ